MRENSSIFSLLHVFCAIREGTMAMLLEAETLMGGLVKGLTKGSAIFHLANTLLLLAGLSLLLSCISFSYR